MNARPSPLVKTIVIVLLVALDMAMAHYLSRQPTVQGWAVVLALLPMTVAVLSLIRRAAGTLLCCAALAGMIGLLVVVLPLLEHNVSWVYFIQNITVNILLGLWFGLSLTHGNEPLCTAFAEQLHPVMNPLLRRYTTHLTQVWTAIFFLMATVSIGLFFLAPLTVWSVFANLLSLPIMALVFVIEYAVRKRILPSEDLLGPTSAFRAYRDRIKRQSTSGNTEPSTLPGTKG